MARLDENADSVGADRRFLVTRQAESFGSGKETACGLAGIIEAAKGADGGG